MMAMRWRLELLTPKQELLVCFSYSEAESSTEPQPRRNYAWQGTDRCREACGTD